MKKVLAYLLLTLFATCSSTLVASEPPKTGKKMVFTFQPLYGPSQTCEVECGSEGDATSAVATPACKAPCVDSKACCADSKSCSVDSKSCCADAKSSCVDSKACCPTGQACCPNGQACTADKKVVCADGSVCSPDGKDCCPVGSTCCPLTSRQFANFGLSNCEGLVEGESIGIDFDFDADAMGGVVALPAQEYAQLLAQNARLEERVKSMTEMNQERMTVYESIFKMQKESMAQMLEMTTKNAKLEAQLAASREKNEYMSSLTDSLVQRAALEARLALLTEQGNYAREANAVVEAQWETPYNRVLNALQELQRSSVRGRPMPVPFASSVYGFEKELMAEPPCATPVTVPEANQVQKTSVLHLNSLAK